MSALLLQNCLLAAVFRLSAKTKKMDKTLKQIQMKPTCLENIHESCFRSYSILEQVLIMVERGDSKETIFEVVEFLKEYPVNTMLTKPSNTKHND